MGHGSDQGHFDLHHQVGLAYRLRTTVHLLRIHPARGKRHPWSLGHRVMRSVCADCLAHTSIARVLSDITPMASAKGPSRRGASLTGERPHGGG